ncbi:EamA family transporter [Frisingicoccus sp.]|uniref:EamA family transporter n=1 Tax=Frisingicoccus sp. TaxID=1918627 RepID=UPI003AB26C06
MMLGSVLALASVLIGAISQILLKTAANKKRDSFLKKFLNITVIVAYGMMFGSSLCSMFALRHLPLNLMPVFQATSFFWVPLLSWLILKEKILKRNIIGICIIFLGILIYLI